MEKTYWETLRNIRQVLRGLVDEERSADEVWEDLCDVLTEDCGEYDENPFDFIY